MSSRDAFVTVPPLEPGAEVTLRFEPERSEALLVRQPSNKGLVVLDARHDPRSGETRITVSVCRAQPLSSRGRGSDGRLPGAGRRRAGPHRRSHACTRTIQALLSKQTKSDGPPAGGAPSRARSGFLDLLVVGDENRFVERTLRISRAARRGGGDGAGLDSWAAIPARTGRVHPDHTPLA